MLDANRMWLAIAAAAVLILGANWLRPPATDPSAERTALVTVKEGDRVRTEPLTRVQCLAQARRIWVALEDGAECIAYVAPQGGISSETVVVFFEGDVPDDLATPEHAAGMVADYQRRAAEAQGRFGLPFIVVGRPGIMGSSGFHLRGGLRDEGEVMSLAVDALKERYGFRRLVLAGQSGGARVVAQLLALGRRDIVCAAMGSGAYGIPRTKGGGQVRTNIFGDVGRRYLVPLQRAESIPHVPERRAFIIGDPRDTRTPFEEQRSWADKMRALGHHAVLLEAVARDAEHHGLATAALVVAGMCANGKSDGEISALVAARNQMQ